MGTHATLGVKMPNNKIVGCYVHYDGNTMRPRIEDYLSRHTTTDLTMLIAEAQARGGMRGFNYPVDEAGDISIFGEKNPTEFLDDNEAYIINEINWKEDHFGARYRYLVDYETGEIQKRTG